MDESKVTQARSRRDLQPCSLGVRECLLCGVQYNPQSWKLIGGVVTNVATSIATIKSTFPLVLCESCFRINMMKQQVAVANGVAVLPSWISATLNSYSEGSVRTEESIEPASPKMASSTVSNSKSEEKSENRQDTETKEDIEFEKSGWIFKKKMGFMQGWKRRWFVLKGTQLSHYETENGKLRRTIDTTTFTLNLNPDHRSRQVYGFSLEPQVRRSNKEVYLLYLENKRDYDDWINIFKSRTASST